MRNIYPCIEQLDLAATQLRVTDNASYARFALILTDNIVELMMHKQCEVEFILDESWAPILPEKQKYKPGLKRRVLGHHFEEKPKFLAKLGKISKDEMDFILVALTLPPKTEPLQS